MILTVQQGLISRAGATQGPREDHAEAPEFRAELVAQDDQTAATEAISAEAGLIAALIVPALQNAPHPGSHAQANASDDSAISAAKPEPPLAAASQAKPAPHFAPKISGAEPASPTAAFAQAALLPADPASPQQTAAPPASAPPAGGAENLAAQAAQSLSAPPPPAQAEPQPSTPMPHAATPAPQDHATAPAPPFNAPPSNAPNPHLPEQTPQPPPPKPRPSRISAAESAWQTVLHRDSPQGQAVGADMAGALPSADAPQSIPAAQPAADSLANPSSDLLQADTLPVPPADQAAAKVLNQIAPPLHHTPQTPPPVAAQLLHHSATARTGGVDVLLQPEELGHVKFQIQQHGDTLRIVLSAERPETVELLRRNADQLLQEFRQSGFAQASLSFGQWGDQQRPPAPPLGNFDLAEIEQDDPPLPPRPQPNTPNLAAGGGLNLRL